MGLAHVVSVWRTALLKGTWDVTTTSTTRTLRYQVSLPEAGITFLAEVDDPLRRPSVRHAHGEVQLLWLLAGAMRIEYEGAAVGLEPGGCCAITAARPHLVVGRTDRRHAAVRFLDVRVAGDGAAPLLAHLERLRFDRALGVPARVAIDAATALADAARAVGGRRTALVLARLWAMLAELAPAESGATAAEDDGGADYRLREAERFMAERLADPIGVADVARAARLSRSQLTRLYAARGLDGPAARLRQLRVERAARLLATSTLSVKEVAAVCGFVSPNHFSRVFEQRMGVPPSRYRAG
jgi:AraC-like DNA-binding protein